MCTATAGPPVQQVVNARQRQAPHILLVDKENLVAGAEPRAIRGGTEHRPDDHDLPRNDLHLQADSAIAAVHATVELGELVRRNIPGELIQPLDHAADGVADELLVLDRVKIVLADDAGGLGQLLLGGVGRLRLSVVGAVRRHRLGLIVSEDHDARRGGDDGGNQNQVAFRHGVWRRRARRDGGSKNGQGRNRTADTAIFSRMLYQLSYLPNVCQLM